MNSKKLLSNTFATLVLQILLLCISINSYSQVNTWQSKQSFGGTPRYLAVGFSIGTKGYMGTGHDGSTTKDFWEYDPATDTWSQKADFGGGPRNAAVGFGIGNKGYVGTGTTNSAGNDDTKDFWEYNPSTNIWTRKADFAGPARQVAIGFSIGNKGYIGPGRTTSVGLFQDFWEYDPATDAWTKKADFGGGARYATSGFSLGAKGYIGTGTDFTGGGYTYRKDFWEYDQNTDTWTRKADFGGSARELAVGFSVGSKGYIGTGLGNADFWEYDNSLDTWARKADFGGGGRNMACGFAVGGKGYIGTGQTYSSYANDLWAYTSSSIPPPVVTSFSPSSGPVGTTVTITGTNFNATPASNIVYFGAVSAIVTGGSTTSLTVTLPAGATYQPISVLNNVIGLTGYSSKPFITTFINPFGTGIPANFYKPKVDFNTNSKPYSVTLVDIDGDGKPDLVYANGYSHTISIRRNVSALGNIGASSFAPAIDFETNADPTAIALGDVDGDGKPDIVVGYRSGSTVSVFRNASSTGNISTSSFATKVDFAVGSGTFSIALADLDKDGKPELIVANFDVHTVSVLHNNSVSGNISASSFADKIDFATGTNPASVAAGDLDGDGKPELVIANYNSYGISVLHNTTSSGTITPSSFDGKIDFGSGAAPFSIAIGDLNGDGKPDIAVDNALSGFVSVFQNTSTLGNFAVSSLAGKVDFTVGGQNVYVAIGDLDGDGKPDLVSANQYTNNISVLRNIAFSGNINSTSFSPKVDFSTGAGSLPISLAIGDIDGDGKAEIATGNYGSNTVSVLQITPCASSPIINLLLGPIDPIAVNTSINLNVTYTGSNVTQAAINWGDGTSVQIVANPASTFTTPHTYISAGVYTINVTLTDACGQTGSSVYQYVVIYDPNGGFVTGGGWINSPAGAYRPDVTLSGKSTFGFESKYQKGATVPSGNTEFKFHVAGMLFKSTIYDWLVISGSKAQYKGSGIINGSGNYGFLLTAVDGNLKTPVTPDLFRIKIWDKNNADVIVYDNQYGATDNDLLNTQIAGGSIVIHTNTTTTALVRGVNLQESAYSVKFTVNASPIPSTTQFILKVESDNLNQAMNLRVLDVLGKVIEIRTNIFVGQTLQIGNKYSPGIYIVEVTQGNNKKQLKLIKL